MEQIMEITGVVLALLGALVFAAAAFGLLKFTDPYTRISAVGTAGGLGMILVVTGALLMMPSVADLVKVVLIIVLQLGAAAIGTMALARAAYLTNVPL
ncbi:MAG: monovalent cation/H(+) antiporter subunit G, partial [Micrococcaceae bacterium]|nr:monovalent cation/H(+) antiporter subunit G [Micrococcaceae bacterium]